MALLPGRWTLHTCIKPSIKCVESSCCILLLAELYKDIPNLHHIIPQNTPSEIIPDYIFESKNARNENVSNRNVQKKCHW
jgi:hypothetical protein